MKAPLRIKGLALPCPRIPSLWLRPLLLLLFLLVLAFIRAAAQPALQTDLPDYPPGSTVTLTGTGFQPGEPVELQVVHYAPDSLGTDPEDHQPWTVVADDSGGFITTWLVPIDGDEAWATLLAKADGLRDDASLNQGYIKRISPNLDKLMIPFDLSRVMAGSGDIPLLREDSVMIFSVQELKDESSITMGGFVRMPGNFTYRKGMTVADAVAMAGGFTNDAASHRLEISRLVRNTSDVVSNQLLTIITVNLDSALSSSAGDLPLEPLDYLYVPRLVSPSKFKILFE
ncbi:MAG: hypothetical protein EOP50_02945 [Sphingobacteriales bacterium]|nr:MAG: hypothetical protein EOP50_02945 [Sphingobacteriales bacterium]